MPIATATASMPPDDDPAKAASFFGHAKRVADGGQLEYAIELYVQGLGRDPEAVDAHQALRGLSLRRAAAGGKPMGARDQRNLPKAKDEKTAMLNAEKKLAYDPGNTTLMAEMLQAAQQAGCRRAAAWIEAIMGGAKP